MTISLENISSAFPPPFKADPLLSRLRFVDIEASGLEDGSYPTEFGICGLDLKPSSFLIRPKEEWKDLPWSEAAERMTGINRSLLLSQGISAVEAGERVETEFFGNMVLSDNPGHDAMWLTRLKDSWLHEGIRPMENWYKSQSLKTAQAVPLTELYAATAKVQRLYPHHHRAGPDALRMAALFRVLVDAEFRRFIKAFNEQRDGLPTAPL